MMIYRHKAWTVLLASLAILLLCSPVFAQDSDEDGFLNDIEQESAQPNTLINGMRALIGDATKIPPCVGTPAGEERVKCLDEETKDLFAILVPVDPPDPSYFPSNTTERLKFFSAISSDQVDGGLGVAVHMVSQADTNDPRYVFTENGQKAVRIFERSDSIPPAIYGEAPTGGTPNQATDETKVYTTRIKERIDGICEGYDYEDCKGQFVSESSYSYGDTLYKNYIWYVNNHEVGHLLKLAPWSSETQDYEYDPDDQVIMSYDLLISAKKRRVIFYIPDKFSSASINNFKLVE